MSDKISVTLNVQVVGGPSYPDSRTIEVEAYDVIEVVIPGGTIQTPGTAAVNVQPGSAGQVKFLMINSSVYDTNLTYKVDTSTVEVKLDAPLLLIGDGAVRLLGETQKAFAFTNKAGSNKSASVKILVGRVAKTP